ncbi:MAG: ion channel [Cyanobacteria bacterium]|nr:ion channel [Cyanobacteriota bacterium]
MASVGDQGDGRLHALRQQSELKRRFHRQLVKLESQFVPLLCSVLLLVVLLPVTAAPGSSFHWLLPLLLTFLITQSLRALPGLKPNRLSMAMHTVQRILGISAIVTMWGLALVGQRSPYLLLRFMVLLLTGLFSMLASLRLVMVLARVPRVNAQVMAGAAAGYLYLGLTGGLVAAALQVLVPGTFSLGSMGGHELLIDRLTYFSFVVLAGLGLGDVLPHNALGERFVILLSLSGTLYLALLMGLLIGRYIATQEVELEFDALADEVEDPDSPIGGRLAGLGRGAPSGGEGLLSEGPPGTQRP